MKMLSLLVCSFACFGSLSADSEEDALKEHVCKVLPTLEGWCSKEKALNFIDLVLEEEPDVCVEIGVFGGSSIFPVAATLQFIGSGVVYAVDPWDKIECLKHFDPIEEEGPLRWWGKVNLQGMYRSYQNMLQMYGLSECVLTVKTTGEKAAPQFEEIDILYLDANYSQVASLKMAMLYLPKVRAGGYIWMNDALSPKMKPTFDLFNASFDKIKEIDNGSCILFRKR